MTHAEEGVLLAYAEKRAEGDEEHKTAEKKLDLIPRGKG